MRTPKKTAYGYGTQDQVQVAMFYSIGIAQGAQAYASSPTAATT